MKITRRELAASMAAGAAALAQQANTPESLVRSATDHLAKETAELRKLSIPMGTEPAFEFHAQ